MDSISEQSFGAKLLRAQNLLQTIQGLSGYAPPNDQDTPAALTTLLENINDANDDTIEKENDYTQAVQAREDAFWNNEDSLNKLLSPLRASVEAQFTKKSHEYENILKHLNSLRNHRSIPKETALIDPQNPQHTNTTAARAISQSEQSYGSLHRHFADLVFTLEAIPNYAPSNPKLQPATLKTFLNTLETLHTDVINNYNSLTNQRALRRSLYEDLLTRIRRIKAYIKAQYGNASPENKAMQNINF